MRRASFEDMNCSIAKTLEIIGEWWTPLILRDAFLGVTRFDDFIDRLGIARNVLTARLETLVEAGVLERRMYDEARQRADYVLTEKGLALWPVMVTIRQWGDEWLVGEGNEPVQLVHKSCGEVANPYLVCDKCDERLERKALRAVDGPGRGDESLIPASRSDSPEPARLT
jgi:DNA-binding HxlR family transcriptional regulator